MSPLLGLIDKKIIRILKTFSKNKENPLYLRQISKESNVPPATVLRLIKKMLVQGIIEEMRVSKFKFYTYHADKKIEEMLR